MKKKSQVEFYDFVHNLSLAPKAPFELSEYSTTTSKKTIYVLGLF